MSNRFFALFAALALTACSGTEEAPPAPAPAVTVAQPLVRTIRDWDDFVGRFEAVQSVEVRPRVTGYLQRVHFTDGQYVRAGAPLFTIDARPAQAALAQARAQVARAEALLANARTELARSETLAGSQAASQEEVEQRQAAVRAGVAEVAAARANVRAQELTVGFTTVRAPVSGRVSERMVDAGNSVVADDTVLTRIVSIDPIHFTFEGSEALLRRRIAGAREAAGRGQLCPCRAHRLHRPDHQPRRGNGARACRAAERGRLPQARHGRPAPDGGLQRVPGADGA
jgi:RND family efflux transporter MFP subunit